MVKQLQARDGHCLRAYSCGSGPRGLVVVQEIFGVNAHIRALCQRFSSQGYTVLSPLLFDRVEPAGEFGLELDYSDVQRGQTLARQVGLFEAPLLDIEACLDAFPQSVPVGLVGYCWGGTLAWLAASRLAGLKASVGYYGGGITEWLECPPDCPVMLHFGKRDPYIPASEVAQIGQAYPGLPIYEYEAGHGFNCEMRADYQAEAAALASRRTQDFLDRHLV